MNLIALNLSQVYRYKAHWLLKLFLTAWLPILFCFTNPTVFLLTQKLIAMNRRSKEPLFPMKKIIPMIRYPYGRTTLLKWLRDKKILQSDNTPYRQYIDRGYFDYQTCIVNKKSGKSVIQPMATLKGIAFLRKLVKEDHPDCPSLERDSVKSTEEK